MRKFGIIALLAACVLSLSACGSDSEIADLDSKAYAGADVSDILAQADTAYNNENYDEASELYLNAMEQNMKSIEARKGLIKSQIKQDYLSLAYSNLETLVSLNPQDMDVYQFYIDLAKASKGNTTYTNRIRQLADQYAIPQLLELLPKAPKFSAEGGEYNEKLTVNVSCEEPGAEIYYRINRQSNNGSGKGLTEFTMTHEPTTLSVWCVVDGIPSEEVTAEYICNYPDEIVQFTDPILENAARARLDRPEGELTDRDLETITNLYYYDGASDMDWQERENVTHISLDDVALFPNLGYFSVYNFEATVDVSALSKCPILYQLRFSDAKFTSLNDFANIPALKYLEVEDSEVTDISALQRMDMLHEIEVQGNPLTQNDLEVLRGNDTLSSITLSSYQIDDYSLLASMEQLTSLDFYNLEHIDFNQLQTLTNLTNLYLHFDYDNRYLDRGDENEAEALNDLSFLSNMTNLTYLYMQGVKDSEQLQYVKKLDKLENLYIYSSEFENDDSIFEELQQALPNCNIRH